MLHQTFKPFPILITERLTLRQLAPNDAQEIFMLRSDSEINKYLDRQLCNTVDDAGAFIHKIIENNAAYWAITLTGKNRLVGTICLFGFSDDHYKCEIGYELLTNFQGQGIMKEAAEKVVDYAFHTLNVKKIDACLHRDNLRSIRLLEKLSFSNANETDEINPDLVCYQLTN